MFVLHKEKILSIIQKPLQYKNYTPKKGRQFDGLEKEKIDLLLTDENAWRQFLTRKDGCISYISGLNVKI